MAGGKETPRQKMIGMMYLVLTALLALNVSKAVLDAFVAIEENIQKANMAQVTTGNSYIGAVDEELKTTPKDAENKAKREKLDFVLKRMEEIDKLTGEMVKKLDDLKIKILTESGEDMSKVAKDNEETILWSKYDKKEQCLPTRMHLMAVQAKDQYDIPMQIICGTAEGGDIKNIKGEGAKLWKDFNNYRKELIELCANYTWGEKTYKMKVEEINKFESYLKLQDAVEKMIEKSDANKNDDGAYLKKMYLELTKPERVDVHGVKDVHWVGATFDHSPLVAAIASLSSMQQHVLTARSIALDQWKSKVTTGEYSFNKIMPLAYGPVVANTGDSVQLRVMMAAFDSDNQPEVILTTEGIESDVKYPGDGVGYVNFKAGGGTEMTVEGTVSIRNKSGVKKIQPWKHNIIIMKPSGSIELPEMNVLYRGYPNIVEATASGYDQTSLNGQGVSISKSGTGYIVKPTTTGRTAKLSVSGKNTATGKTASLKTVEYRVMNLPAPQMYLGTIATGEVVSSSAVKNMNRLFAKYPPEIPLKATFGVTSYEVSVSGAPRTIQGTGAVLSSQAMSLIKQARPGSTISIAGKYKGMGYAGNMATIIKVK